jgi:Clp amino terminal domain, pathogenicity island component
VQLPSRPSLSHLRKQAKDLLLRLRQQDPDATLADAQHALARQYEFDSWPKLKVQVELLAKLPPALTFQRYTSKAKEAVFFSWCEASEMGSGIIEPEHVLLGLIRASHGLKAGVFQQIAASLDAARDEIGSRRTGTEPTPSPTRTSTGERTQRVFRTAAEEADALQHQDIGLAHILLGVLHEPQSAAATLLDRRDVRRQSVRDDIAELLDEEPM